MLRKKILVVGSVYPQQNTEPDSLTNEDIDWGKCCLCQQTTSDPLRCPIKINKRDVEISSIYKTLAEHLEAFHKLDCLPENVNYVKLAEGHGLENNFNFHCAKYHKNCRDRFNSTKLQRILKRRNSDDTKQESTPKKVTRLNKSETPKSTEKNDNECFFCDESTGTLHRVETFNVDQRIRQAAYLLQDTMILGKLSSGDLMANDATYHLSCLAAFYRRADKAYRGIKTDVTANRLYGIALAELVTFIEEATNDSNDIAPVFKLSYLTSMYTSRLEHLGCDMTRRVHSTDLKNRILEHFPTMQAHKQGREVLLIFNKDIGDVLRAACWNNFDEEAIILAKAANIVRRDMKELERGVFKGEFEEQCQDKSVPQSLLTLVSMILEGPNIKDQASSIPQASLTLAQLLLFNFSIRRRAGSTAIFHSILREPPLPLYLGMKLHAETRKRGIIDMLFKMGISVSYDRVLALSTDIGNAVCKRFEEEHIVCPPKLRKDLFTTGAVDNIDHNPSSTTAHGSLHGTGISLFQHLSPDFEGHQRDVVVISETQNRKTIQPLPDTYSSVPPVILKESEPAIPESPGPVIPTGDSTCIVIQGQYSWLSHVKDVIMNAENDVIMSEEDSDFEQNKYLSWAAFHANATETSSYNAENVDISALLPLFQETSKSPAMIKHAMSIVQRNVEFLNPGQTPVIAFDQPLFTLAKKIQWNYPVTHGEEKTVVMFGGLHIEMAALKSIGDWLEDSGWTEAMAEAGIASPGTADSFLKATHISRTRHAHQITASSLHILMHKAFSEYQERHGEEQLRFENWRAKRSVESPTFQYWDITLAFELNILVFVQSLRTGNFQLYKDILVKIIPWFFALDHTNYARWLPVHIRDMMSLPLKHPAIETEFQRGKFVVRKTRNVFSSIPIDQAHEQNNKCVKSDGGAVGLTENTSELLRWMVSGPEIARILQDFETSQESMQPSRNEESHNHHEQTRCAQVRFQNEVAALVDVMSRMGNPFMEESSDLVILNSRNIADEGVATTVRNIERIGREQFDDFVEKRLITKSESVFACLKRNKLPLLRCPPPRDMNKEKLQINSLKKSCSLFSQLYISCQVRGCDLDEFFRHENQAYPPSLSQFGTMRSGTKSTLLTCLETYGKSEESMPSVDAKLFDGAAIVNILKPGVATTFQEYSHDVFLKYIRVQLEDVSRIDIVWDRYKSDSLKAITRSKRGKGVRRRVEASAKLPSSWDAFLRIDDNKTELFGYLSQQSVQIDCGEKVIISTCNEGVLSSPEQDLSRLSPCSHEEADTRLMLHAADCVNAGHTRILMRTVDTDVVVIAVAMCHKMPEITQFWVAFGVGKHYRYIPVHEIASSLGPEKSAALPVLHAFTGCDQTSFLFGCGKKTAWDIWEVFQEATTAFLAVSELPSEQMLAENIQVLERYVVLMYDRTSNCHGVNEARKELFTKKARTMEVLPPTFAALMQHSKRVIFQAGYIWGQALIATPFLPCPSEWGWRRNRDHIWEPLWTTLPEAAKSCQLLIRCSCNPDKGCKGHCKCVKNNLSCTALCKCDGNCDQ